MIAHSTDTKAIAPPSPSPSEPSLYDDSSWPCPAKGGSGSAHAYWRSDCSATDPCQSAPSYHSQPEGSPASSRASRLQDATAQRIAAGEACPCQGVRRASAPQLLAGQCQAALHSPCSRASVTPSSEEGCAASKSGCKTDRWQLLATAQPYLASEAVAHVVHLKRPSAAHGLAALLLLPVVLAFWHSLRWRCLVRAALLLACLALVEWQAVKERPCDDEALIGLYPRPHDDAHMMGHVGKHGARPKDTAVTTDRHMLAWSAISCSVTGKTGKEDLLRQVSGVARPGRLLAIMGPSGSGKTTLLDILADQTPFTRGMAQHGSITINGETATGANRRQGYVRQDMPFFAHLTAREVLNLEAELCHARGHTPLGSRHDAVASLVQQLRLSSCADTLVGNAKTKGLSGGQKKQLAIASELLAGPPVLFLDEPIAGLDSFSARKVMTILKQLANEEGRTVIISVHQIDGFSPRPELYDVAQPSSGIFALVDDLYLLSGGCCIYSGRADEALEHFRCLGYACPSQHNPAEFLTDLVSVDDSTPDALYISRLRMDRLVKHSPIPAQGLPASSDAHAVRSIFPARRAAFLQRLVAGVRLQSLQLVLLFRRAMWQSLRDRATHVSRAIASLSSAVIFGCIFWQLGHSQASVQSRMGLLQVCAVNCAMTSLTKTLGTFAQERVIVGRELSKGSYRAGAYFLAKLAAEAPVSALFPAMYGIIIYLSCGLYPSASRLINFLLIITLESFTASALGLAVGSVAPSRSAAQAIGPAIAVVSITFGGYYMSAAAVPGCLRWLPSTSLIYHAFRGLCVNEFQGLSFTGTAGQALRPGQVATGEQALERLAFQDMSLGSACVSQLKLLALLYGFTWVVLTFAKPRAQPLLAPDSKI